MSLPTRSEIALFWSECESNQFLIDIGEPACFACGYFREGWDNPKTWKARWNKSGLERAHIIAESQGGTPDCNNLVLLCKRCHKDAPMTLNRGHMIQWCESRESWWAYRCQQFQDECAKVGVSQRDLDSADEKALINTVREALRSGRVGDHAGTVSLASVAFIIHEFLHGDTA